MRDAENKMELVVNGEPYEGDATTLAELADQMGYAGQRVATAVNGDFVASAERETFELRDGDEVEIVAPRQGG